MEINNLEQARSLQLTEGRGTQPRTWQYTIIHQEYYTKCQYIDGTCESGKYNFVSWTKLVMKYEATTGRLKLEARCSSWRYGETLPTSTEDDDLSIAIVRVFDNHNLCIHSSRIHPEQSAAAWRFPAMETLGKEVAQEFRVRI